MEELFNNLLSLNFLIVCVALFSGTQLIKSLTEYLLPNKDNKLWKDVILPSLPVLLGVFAAFLPNELMMGDFTSFRAKVLFGVFAGFSSSYIVRIFKSFLKKKI